MDILWQLLLICVIFLVVLAFDMKGDKWTTYFDRKRAAWADPQSRLMEALLIFCWAVVAFVVVWLVTMAVKTTDANLSAPDQSAGADSGRMSP